jgi:hypothetical protein
MSIVDQQQEMMRKYKEGLANGLPQKDAAKQAQAATGLSMRTGLPIKGATPKESKGLKAFKGGSKGVAFGVYG